jgi:hypothetical protein
MPLIIGNVQNETTYYDHMPWLRKYNDQYEFALICRESDNDVFHLDIVAISPTRMIAQKWIREPCQISCCASKYLLNVKQDDGICEIIASVDISIPNEGIQEISIDPTLIMQLDNTVLFI